MRWSICAARAQLLGFDLFAFQKLVQDFVVVFSDGLYYTGRERLRLFFLSSAGISSSDVLGAHVSSCQTIALHVDQINDALKLVFLPDGNLIATGLAFKRLRMVSTACSKSAPILSILLMKQMRGTPYLSAGAKLFPTALHAVNCVKHRHGPRQERATSVPLQHEIHMAGRINNVVRISRQVQVVPRT